MDGPTIAALVPLAALIGGGFGWLIKEIVSSSKTAVKELREANATREAKLEAERDVWRDRALRAGWRGGRMSQLLTRLQDKTRSFLGLDWLREAREIAEAARKQREEDEAKANRDPHDMARWLQEPREYRRPRPEERP